MWLSDVEVRRVLAFLYQAGEIDGPDAFTEPVLEAFWDLIPSDAGAACNVFADEDPDVVLEQRSVLAFATVDSDWCIGIQTHWDDAFDEVCRRHVETEEAIPPVPVYMNRPVRQSDVMTRREQQRRELWASVERVRGVEETLVLWLPAPEEGILRRITFGSAKRGGIRDRDVRVLEMLVPHLAQLHRRAAVRRRTAAWPGELTPREREVLSLVAQGQTNREVARSLWISPHTVRRHLENVFDKLGVTTRAAAVALLVGTNGQNGHERYVDRGADPPAVLPPGATLINKHAY